MSETSSLFGGPAPEGSAMALYNRPSAGYAAKVHATVELLKAAAFEHPGKVVQATSLGVEDMVMTSLPATNCPLPLARWKPACLPLKQPP
jgi:phosphoadenosine phosphosulfate reductase